MSPKLLNSLPFRFMRWNFGLVGADERTERALEHLLVRTLDESGLDRAVVLAFNGVYDRDGNARARQTQIVFL